MHTALFKKNKVLELIQLHGKNNEEEKMWEAYMKMYIKSTTSNWKENEAVVAVKCMSFIMKNHS